MDTIKSYLVTEYYLLIKTAPHQEWIQPGGWGPYYVRAEASTACRRADRLWMRAAIHKQTVERSMTSREAADLQRIGAKVASLGTAVRS
jgi:hypothetical protein